VGTVNTAEFLLAVAISVSFIATLGLTAFGVAAVGMIVGGVIAAPFGAVLVKRVPPRVLLFAVSIVLVATSLFSALRGWGVI